MAEQELNLLRNDHMGGGRPRESLDYYYNSIRYNIDTSLTLYLIDSTLSGNAGTLKVNDHDASQNGDREKRGNIFRGTSDSDGGGFRLKTSVKYNRKWGAYMGDTSVNDSNDTSAAWLHGVKGIEMNWKIDGHWGHHRIWHFGICYTNRNKNTSRVFYMPLIFDAKLYSGAVQNYTGFNLNNQTSDGYSNSRSGRICVRGNSTMCNAVDTHGLIMSGIWFAMVQDRKSDANKNYYTHFYNGKPIFNRDSISSSYKAILPSKHYDYGDACSGLFPIANS